MGLNCWGWGPGSFFGPPFGMIIGVVFWVLILYGIFVIISRVAKRPMGSTGSQEAPIDILKKRYARGEMDSAEFARRKQDLEA